MLVFTESANSNFCPFYLAPVKSGISLDIHRFATEVKMASPFKIFSKDETNTKKVTNFGLSVELRKSLSC